MEKSRRTFRWHYLLLCLPLALLWVPFYNRLEPALFGLPFFYWYQMAWVVLAALLTFLVYWLDGRKA
ncbi:hypothetical protein FHS83_001466 [Rhizomicrobium palustre]|uniref:DUF3311 domain-containing protein n=1 Tax=Rhizomicrobium palustre TaxID=189966 RepID=A0A846MX63_9PROT|nr:DUF3311 domain-containing protein [Rhizomicrobium palustre]NIK88148.1 hypothetical protein [Rhizomicrobium palustre]